MKPNRVWIICESRCTGFPRAYKTKEDLYAELQHNDEEIPVIELSHHNAIVQPLVEALEVVNCDCSVEERLSGHMAGCFMPEVKEALDNYRKQNGGEHGENNKT